MPRKEIKRKPYEQCFYAPTPTKGTRRMRQSVFWQLWRFVAINLKMLKLMAKSHH